MIIYKITNKINGKSYIGQTTNKKGIPNTKLKGMPKTEEHKQKLRLAKLGKKQTKEHALNAAKSRIDKKLKIVLITNKQINVSFSVKGFKYLKDLGFDKSRVYRVINTNKVYKNCTFKYASLSETKLKGL